MQLQGLKIQNKPTPPTHENSSGPVATTEGEPVKAFQGQHRRFTPPSSIPEFEVETLLLHPQDTLRWPAIDGPAIVLVLGGEGSVEGAGASSDREGLHRGCVLFVGANTDLRFKGAGAGSHQEPLHVAIAHHNTRAR